MEIVFICVIKYILERCIPLLCKKLAILKFMFLIYLGGTLIIWDRLFGKLCGTMNSDAFLNRVAEFTGCLYVCLCFVLRQGR